MKKFTTAFQILAFSWMIAPRLAAADQQETKSFELPPIHSQGDSRFGKPPTRPESLSSLAAELKAIGKRGTWRIDKRWEVIINSLQPTEVPTLLDVVAQLTPSDAREEMCTSFYSRWGEMDPASAIARIAKETDPVTRGNCLQAVIGGWAHANAGEVLAWAEQLPAGPVKLMAYVAATPYTTANSDAKSVGNQPDGGATAADPRSALAEASRIPDRDRRLAAYKAIAKEWAAANPAEAAQWAIELPFATEREALIETIANTWSRSDPERAITFLAVHPEVPRYVLERSVNSWAGRDLPAVVQCARRLPEAKQRNVVLMTILPSWVDRSPDDAADFIASLPLDSYEFSTAGSNAIARWAETDPNRVFALWRKLPPDGVGRLLGPELLKPLVRSSPERLLDFLRELPPGRRTEPYANTVAALAAKNPDLARKQLAVLSGAGDEIAIRRTVVRRLIDTNFDLALQLYTELPPGQPQIEALQTIADQWSRRDPVKALAWVRSLPASPMTQNAIQTTIRQLAQSDPKGALHEVEALPASPMRRGLTAELVATLATKDFPAARSYLQTIQDGDVHEAVLIAVAQRVGYGDPEKGLDLLLMGESTNERMNALQQIATNWVQNDLAAAQHWAERQPNAAVREMFVLVSLYPLCQSSPAAAAAQLDRLTLPQNLQRGLGIVAQSWTNFDPAAAANWAAGRPAGSVRDQAVGAVLGQWVQMDYSAATHWALGLPPNVVPDEAWTQLAQSTFNRQPADAMRWAGQIKNEKVRDDTIVRLAGYWLRQNRAVAEAWLTDSGLSSETIERIRGAGQPGH